MIYGVLEGSAVGMIVTVAAHWQNALRRDGINVLDPMLVNPAVAWQLNRTIAKFQKEGAPHMAVGLMVWLHTIRAATTPEIRLMARQMWGELSRGFPYVLEAKIELQDLAGIVSTILHPMDRIFPDRASARMVLSQGVSLPPRLPVARCGRTSHLQ